MEDGDVMVNNPENRQQNAYECTEWFTPDGKKLAGRHRSWGPQWISGAVTIVVVLVGALLVLTGHDIAAGSVTLGGIAKGLQLWYKHKI